MTDILMCPKCGGPLTEDPNKNNPWRLETFVCFNCETFFHVSSILGTKYLTSRKKEEVIDP